MAELQRFNSVAMLRALVGKAVKSQPILANGLNAFYDVLKLHAQLNAQPNLRKLLKLSR